MTGWSLPRPDIKEREFTIAFWQHNNGQFTFYIVTDVFEDFTFKTSTEHEVPIIMNTYTNYSTMSETYGFFWGKYRPVILKLMISSAEAPQQYKFSSHEVAAANPKSKGRVTFSLTVHKGKAVNDIRTSPIAKDLLVVLQQSAKAAELTESSPYEFKFDKHFVLHVTKANTQSEVQESSQDVSVEQVEG